MKFDKKLKYKNGTLDFYHYANVKEAGMTAKILIVPGQYFDNHMKQSIKLALPVYASAMSKNHPDYDDMFGNAFPEKDNLIFIRDEILRLANKKELQSLIEHEFGHIFFDYSGEILSRYDYEEQKADIFVDDIDSMHSLEKKWCVYNYKNCERCKTKILLDDKTIVNHWYLYCPNCGWWIGDGMLNPFYLECHVKEIVGIWKDTGYKKKYKPILSRDDDIMITTIITEAKLSRKGGHYGKNR